VAGCRANLYRLHKKELKQDGSMTESISLSFRQPEAQLGDSRRQGTRGTKMGSNITTYAKNFILCAQEITESSRGHSMINNFFFFFYIYSSYQ